MCDPSDVRHPLRTLSDTMSIGSCALTEDDTAKQQTAAIRAKMFVSFFIALQS